MNQGMELDRSIGERLGFEVITEKEDVKSRQQTEHKRGTIALYGDHYVLRRKGLPSVMWAPSTSWTSMQLVVEEMQLRGFDVALESSTDTLHDGRIIYHARFFRRIEGHYGEYDSAISFSHAVCMSALNALDGQDDD